eukprot:SAG31_NODE_2037_length_6604_cov_2.820600_2_plen_90_part_00
MYARAPNQKKVLAVLVLRTVHLRQRARGGWPRARPTRGNHRCCGVHSSGRPTWIRAAGHAKFVGSKLLLIELTAWVAMLSSGSLPRPPY